MGVYKEYQEFLHWITVQLGLHFAKFTFQVIEDSLLFAALTFFL